MKKLALVTLLIAGSATAYAEPKLVPADDSELSRLCVAAVESRDSLTSTAREFGYGPLDLQELRCNGLPVARFAAKYRATVAATTTAPEGYILRPSDDSPLAALCIAAASSDLEYARVKEQYFGNESNLESEVMCNGVPLKNFARRFRDAQTLIVTQR